MEWDVCPKCFNEFDPIGEENCCPVCDAFLGGKRCDICEFMVEEEMGELDSGKRVCDRTCTYNGKCPFDA